MTYQNSHVDISTLGRRYLCTAPTKRFISWVIYFIRSCNDPTEITRNHFCDVFLKNQKYLGEMFLRRLWEVMEKTSFWRCAPDVLKTPHKRHLFWDILKTSQKRHLFWDISERSVRYLSQWRSDWDLSETSHADWVML